MTTAAPQIRAFCRLHTNGTLGIVHEMLDREGPVYSGGTLPTTGIGMLRYGLRTFDNATAYADAEARSMGHRCDAGCEAWPEYQSPT